jgi:hypothetical protein
LAKGKDLKISEKSNLDKFSVKPNNFFVNQLKNHMSNSSVNQTDAERLASSRQSLSFNSTQLTPFESERQLIRIPSNSLMTQTSARPQLNLIEMASTISKQSVFAQETIKNVTEPKGKKIIEVNANLPTVNEPDTTIYNIHIHTIEEYTGDTSMNEN